ncbi:MAG: hypothetical protein WA865_07190 [Spirulinaceae cyanobacterium]
MKSNNLFEFVKQGFRVTLGATTALVETVQDSQKREQTLAELSSNLSQKVQEWAAKGEITEQEARQVVEQFINNQQASRSSSPSQTVDVNTTPTTSAGVSNTYIQTELEELTSQITALRSELEQERK